MVGQNSVPEVTPHILLQRPRQQQKPGAEDSVYATTSIYATETPVEGKQKSLCFPGEISGHNADAL